MSLDQQRKSTVTLEYVACIFHHKSETKGIASPVMTLSGRINFSSTLLGSVIGVLQIKTDKRQISKKKKIFIHIYRGVHRKM